MSTPPDDVTPPAGSGPAGGNEAYDDVLEQHDDALPPDVAQVGGGMVPERLDDDALARATQQERVAAGLADYAPDDVPPATDPLPEGSAQAADRTQRGITDDASG